MPDPITSALIIRKPWIGLILDGCKTWEMRSKATSRRDWIGLIESRSGEVKGVVRLVDSLPPITLEQYPHHFDQHRVPPEKYQNGTKYLVPWVLADVRRLRQPVPYQIRSGAVVWVSLTPDVTAAITRQLADDQGA